jgi:Zn-dependent M28 family amino/carboxypeptidase
MHLRPLIVLLVAALLPQAAGAPAPAPAGSWWSHVAVLADDNMEGRDTGSAAHRRAAEYVSAQFEKAGLHPAGVEGYLQTVALKVRRINEAQSSLTLMRDGQAVPLVLGVDAAISLRVDPVSKLEAPLVFVGHGLKIPEQGIDDLAGLDLKGAMVVYVSATPRTLPGPLQAHFGSAAERWKMYQAAGAVGTISIANPRSSDVPWARASLARLQPSMSLADEALADAPGQQLALAINPAQADKLLLGSGHTFAEILALMDAGKTVPRFVLPSRLQATVAVERSTVKSQNVAGVLRGSDPTRADEYVVLSAHLDHLGVGEPIQGDRINNGAMDNASGIAALLEVARALHESPSPPARSILFLAVTGEEKGQLGSRWFAAHPTVPRAGIVANVNTDMFLPLFPLKILMVLGLDESTLGDDIRATARQLGLAVQADPEPQRNRFVRSDQYSFIKIGVPALAMKVGYEANTPEAATAAQWTAERYHAPSDDLSQPVDLAAGEKYIEVLRDLAARIANRTDRPAWNETSFFKRFARKDSLRAKP